MILEVVQSKWSLTWYDPLGPRMCILELMNRHVLQTLRETLISLGPTSSGYFGSGASLTHQAPLQKCQKSVRKVSRKTSKFSPVAMVACVSL